MFLNIPHRTILQEHRHEIHELYNVEYLENLKEMFILYYIDKFHTCVLPVAKGLNNHSNDASLVTSIVYFIFKMLINSLTIHESIIINQYLLLSQT